MLLMFSVRKSKEELKAIVIPMNKDLAAKCLFLDSASASAHLVEIAIVDLLQTSKVHE